MYGLVDCNNFYASCERVFRPELNGKPIVVLSNNDGCVIARSNEVKQLGIKMGVPFYQIKDLVESKKIYAFSSNYTLYGDMSSRIMNMLADFTPNFEVYSIDEAFLDLGGFDNLQQLGHKIVKEIISSIGIPVSLGIAPTKTLAKIANKFAKKYKAYNRMCLIDDDTKRQKALKLTELKDVWGIGRRINKKLEAQGIFTAYDFTLLPLEFVRKNFTIVGERMWYELRGIPCIDLELIEAEKKQICTSRSFGSMVDTLEELTKSVATHATKCAKKLRAQKTCAVSLGVFINTNRFRKDLAQCTRWGQYTLDIPTNDTLQIVKAALAILNKIYLAGFQYKKAGVIITQVTPQTTYQNSLFAKIDLKSSQLMQAIDKISARYQEDIVHVAAIGTGGKWELKRELLSPAYTTRFSEIMEINA